MRNAFLALLVVGTACTTPAVLHQKAGQSQNGFVERATFTTAIEDREPQNSVRVLPNDQRKVYYFTELRNMEGQTVTHRWKFKGKVMAEIPFSVQGNRWRVYSSKSLEPQWLGQWTAAVVDSKGRTLTSAAFSYAQSSRNRTTQTKPSPKRYVPAAPAAESILERGARGAQSLYRKVFGND